MASFRSCERGSSVGLSLDLLLMITKSNPFRLVIEILIIIPSITLLSYEINRGVPKEAFPTTLINLFCIEYCIFLY